MQWVRARGMGTCWAMAPAGRMPAPSHALKRLRARAQARALAPHTAPRPRPAREEEEEAAWLVVVVVMVVVHGTLVGLILHGTLVGRIRGVSTIVLVHVLAPPTRCVCTCVWRLKVLVTGICLA